MQLLKMAIKRSLCAEKYFFMFEEHDIFVKRDRCTVVFKHQCFNEKQMTTINYTIRSYIILLHFFPELTVVVRV